MIINQYFVLWQVKLDKGFALQAAPPFILLLSVVFALDQNFTSVIVTQAIEPEKRT